MEFRRVLFRSHPCCPRPAQPQRPPPMEACPAKRDRSARPPSDPDHATSAPCSPHRAGPAASKRPAPPVPSPAPPCSRSEEHTSELQSLMRISYAVFCLKKKKTTPTTTIH